jgi:hypothetical protein
MAAASPSFLRGRDLNRRPPKSREPVVTTELLSRPNTFMLMRRGWMPDQIRHGEGSLYGDNAQAGAATFAEPHFAFNSATKAGAG